MADRFSVSCPKCGLGVELEMGLWAWRSTKCPRCNEKITFDKSRMQIKHCAVCNQDVVYDLARKNRCPICQSELVRDDEERVSVVCPDCDCILELEKGRMLWKNATCPQCGKKIRMKDQETQIVECPTCKRSVEYNIIRRNSCPSCHSPLFAPASRPQGMTISCPGCQAEVRYSAGERHVICPVCRKDFDPVQVAEERGSVIRTTAADISMNVELPRDQLFWKHPMSGQPLSLDSRIIGKAGMTAVVVQGDQQAFAVSGQSVMLSETSLKADAYAYGQDDTRRVIVDIYYVRNILPDASLLWGGSASLMGDHANVFEFALNGSCELDAIVDHAAFLRWIGFDEQVTAKDFAVVHNEFGQETAGAYAVKISKGMRDVYGEALRQARDQLGIMPNMLPLQKDLIAERVQQLANQQLRKWGVAIKSVVADNVRMINSTTFVDPLRARVEGHLKWETMPIPVHIKDKPLATARLRMRGGLYITVIDEARLKRSTVAARWANTANENEAREELGRQVGEVLGTMFASVFQNLIEDMNPRLDMLSAYAGYLKAQATQLINAPDALLMQMGLSAGNLTLTVEIAEKSALYALEEQSALTISESEIREKLREYEENLKLNRKRNDMNRAVEANTIETQAAVAQIADRQKLDQANAAAEAAAMENQAHLNAARDQLAHQQEMAQLGYQAEEDAAYRRYSFAAWQEENQAEAIKEQEAMNALRRRNAHVHQTQLEQAQHERAMHDILRAVEESDQSWREKLDTYARLQRNLAVQDQLEQRTADRRADVDDRMYEGFQSLHLDTETQKVATTMVREAAAFNEELEKARFARDLELRRQALAEEMERLNAEYQQENRRQELESENETLRLMLEYLARQGEQQLAQTGMKALIAQAEAEAERVARQEREEDARHKEQVARDNQLADRAYELTREMLAAQTHLAELEKANERAYQSGRAAVDMKGRQYQEEQIAALTRQMETLQQRIKDMTAQNAREKEQSRLKKWFTGMMQDQPHAAQPAPQAYAVPVITQPVYTPPVHTQPMYAPPYTPPVIVRRCPYCQAELSPNAIRCPNCHRCS